MIIGTYLLAQDNDSYFLEDILPPEECCPKCGYILNFIQYFNPFFKVKRKVHDISYTYDGRCIVSLRFKEFCEREQYKGISFKEFEMEPSFYLFTVQNILEFDSIQRETEFISYCDKCKNYDEVIGFSNGVLKNVQELLIDGFYRTDLLFGSGNSKHPFIIIGLDTQKKMKREKMRGAYYETIRITTCI